MSSFTASLTGLKASLNVFKMEGSTFRGLAGNNAMFNQAGGDMSVDPPLGLIIQGLNEAGKMYGMKAEMTRMRDQALIPDIIMNFRDEGRPVPWMELSPFTIEKRLKDGYSAGPILRRSDRLYRAATAKARWSMVINNAAGSAVMNYGVGKGAFPISVWYASIHQGGGDFSFSGGSVLPARPFAVLSEEGANKIEKMTQTWASKKWDKVPTRSAY